jgi:hypothetical protein
LEIAALLLTEGANANAKDDRGRTPLHLIADENRNIGQKEFAEFLIGHGADVNVKDNNGSTPLHYASQMRSLRKSDDQYEIIMKKLKVAEILIANGANLNAKNNRGKSPLAIAIENDYRAMIDLLKKHGAVE